MNGFISLHRKLTEWEWYTDPNTKSVFIHLLLMASWKDSKWKGIVIKRGEVVTGRKELSKSLGISQQSIRTSLTRLKSTSEITIKTTNKYSVISIKNYDAYQQINQQINQQLTNNQPHLNTNNKENKIIRDEKFFFDEYGNRSQKRKAGAGNRMHSLKELLQKKNDSIGNKIQIAI